MWPGPELAAHEVPSADNSAGVHAYLQDMGYWDVHGNWHANGALRKWLFALGSVCCGLVELSGVVVIHSDGVARAQYGRIRGLYVGGRCRSSVACVKAGSEVTGFLVHPLRGAANCYLKPLCPRCWRNHGDVMKKAREGGMQAPWACVRVQEVVSALAERYQVPVRWVTSARVREVEERILELLKPNADLLVSAKELW